MTPLATSNPWEEFTQALVAFQGAAFRASPYLAAPYPVPAADDELGDARHRLIRAGIALWRDAQMFAPPASTTTQEAA